MYNQNCRDVCQAREPGKGKLVQAKEELSRQIRLIIQCCDEDRNKVEKSSYDVPRKAAIV